MSKPLPTQDDVARLLADPATSSWLRAAIRASYRRDSVDALNDAETLVAVLLSWGTLGRPESEAILHHRRTRR